jgi:pimeloyl-ACP methyl ester carboxylesterase
VPEPRLLEAAGARIAVREWGERDGTPILYWHALGPVASGAVLAEVAPRLAKWGFRVAAVDGPGFGESPLLPPERYSLASLIDLAAGVADELGFERFVAMGHSWGGAISVRLAASRPDRVRALVLVDSGHIDYRELPDVDPEQPVEWWIEFARERSARWESRESFEAELRDGERRLTPELLEAYLAGTRSEGGTVVGSPAEARGAAMWGLLEPVSPAWPALSLKRIPTLLLLATEEPHGSQNREHLPRFLAVASDSTDVRWMEGAGHGILADVGPDLGDSIGLWLSQKLS